MNLAGFDKWHPLDSLAIKDVPKRDKSGFVYVFRRHSTREVLYIGSTTDLCRRLFGNYIGGVGGRTTQRIHALLFEKGDITDTDVAWKEATGYTSEEKRLRQAYFQREGQLPIWNKQL